jgi:hypothetical protein
LTVPACIVLLNCFAYAGIFVCHNDNGSITNKVFSGGAIYSNDPNCFRITAEQYNTVTNATHKASGGVLVELTQQELDDRAAAEAAAIAAAEVARIKAFDDSVDNAQIGDAVLPKMDLQVDSVVDWATWRIYEKKKLRYDLND